MFSFVGVGGMGGWSFMGNHKDQEVRCCCCRILLLGGVSFCGVGSSSLGVGVSALLLKWSLLLGVCAIPGQPSPPSKAFWFECRDRRDVQRRPPSDLLSPRL